MVQGGSGACFATEAFDGLTVVGNVVGKKFKSDVAAETGVFGFVHHAHTTAAKLFKNGVMGDGAAKQGGSIGHEGMEFNAENGMGQLRRPMLCKRRQRKERRRSTDSIHLAQCARWRRGVCATAFW